MPAAAVRPIEPAHTPRRAIVRGRPQYAARALPGRAQTARAQNRSASAPQTRAPPAPLPRRGGSTTRRLLNRAERGLRRFYRRRGRAHALRLRCRIDDHAPRQPESVSGGGSKAAATPVRCRLAVAARASAAARSATSSERCRANAHAPRGERKVDVRVRQGEQAGGSPRPRRAATVRCEEGRCAAGGQRGGSSARRRVQSRRCTRSWRLGLEVDV